MFSRKYFRTKFVKDGALQRVGKIMKSIGLNYAEQKETMVEIKKAYNEKKYGKHELEFESPEIKCYDEKQIAVLESIKTPENADRINKLIREKKTIEY